MSRKKLRYKDKQPKPPVAKQPEPPLKAPMGEAPEPDQKITRYKAVVRSPRGEWWHENKKRVRLFSLIGGGGLLIGWLLFELLNFIF